MVQTCRGVGLTGVAPIMFRNVWEWGGQVWYISNYIHIYI